MKFIDSNILVYLADRHDNDKREVAKSVVADAMRYPEGYLISTQTLAEFSNVCLHKFKIDVETVRNYIGFLRELKVVSYLPSSVDRALEVKAKYQLQFYDSLLLATAESNGCDVFLSEDLNPGQMYCGMTVVNPFTG